LKIANLDLKNKIFLAPMAGVTDLPFRLLCKEQGCGLAFTEMVSAKAIYFNNEKSHRLLQVEEAEKPIGVQLFGDNPKTIASMAKKIDHEIIDVFDINMGCPVPKIVNNNEGSALMKNPKLVGEIVYELANRINKPVSVKIRKGFDDAHVNAVEIAKIAEENGASFVTVHGRTREQYYSGQVDLSIIKAVKAELKIPVIGNGDIFSAEDAKKMLEETGCDGIMVARGCQGNPWLFREINHYLKYNQLIEKPSREEIIQTILRHGEMLVNLKGAYIGMREMRKHVSWYTKGMKNSTKMRQQINQIEQYEDFKALIGELF
jgi:nifR3 family TIM-barrel protein